MLCVPAYTHERRPYSATLYPSSFTVDTFSALTILLVGDFSCDCVFWEKRGGGITRQRVGLPVSAATITTVMGADPIRALCTRLALLLILSLPSRLVPNVRLTVGVPPRVL